MFRGHKIHLSEVFVDKTVISFRIQNNELILILCHFEPAQSNLFQSTEKKSRKLLEDPFQEQQQPKDDTFLETNGNQDP